jgi:hypothetical protein
MHCETTNDFSFGLILVVNIIIMVLTRKHCSVLHPLLNLKGVKLELICFEVLNANSAITNNICNYQQYIPIILI